MQPDQAKFLLEEVFLPGLKNEHRITKSVIQAIPLDEGDYRPDGVSKSALDLAWHIVASEIGFLNAVSAGKFDLSPVIRDEQIKNSGDLTSWYAGKFNERYEQLPKLSNEQLARVVDFRGMFQMPAVMYLDFLLHHSIHHRGQLSMYLRPVGAKVPAMYGESFDSSEARKTAGK